MFPRSPCHCILLPAPTPLPTNCPTNIQHPGNQKPSMDSFAPVKDEASRRHPEDRQDSDVGSDIDSNASINDFDIDSKNDDDFEIPGTGPNDMSFFKNSTKLTGSYQTVSLQSHPSLTCVHMYYQCLQGR
ncbi:hypothetical protein BDD12DRAFT_429747 [Trichophaea hybrida]|nr:hypothetical protein BDD12DRAFT_429747 [Trichophaea hybrida]